MTVKQIDEAKEQSEIIFDSAREIVEILDSVLAQVKALNGDGEAARRRVIELVTAE